MIYFLVNAYSHYSKCFTGTLLFTLSVPLFIYWLLFLLSPLCRVFTIIYWKQTMFLGYTVWQPFCIYSLCYMKCYFTPEIYFVLLHYYCCCYVICFRSPPTGSSAAFDVQPSPQHSIDTDHTSLHEHSYIQRKSCIYYVGINVNNTWSGN